MLRLRQELGRLFEATDNGSLAIFRVAFGALMIGEVGKYLREGRIHETFLAPDFRFTYLGLGWVRPWPGGGLYLHFLVLLVAAACIALGYCYRAAATVFFLGFTYVFLLDAAQYLNHHYLLCLISFLMIFVPAHGAWSLDAWLRRGVATRYAPAWALFVLRAQMGMAYLYAGIAKINADWLQGEPLRGWLSERASYPILGRWFDQAWPAILFAWGGMFFDLLVVPLLLWHRTRWAAFAVALFFHVSNAHLFSIGVFPWFALAASTLFFPPDWPRRLAARAGLAAALVAAVPPQPARPRWVVPGLALYLAWQALMPLRHLVYPGPVSWTEEGHNFAWHMKLRDKDCGVRIAVRDGRTGEVHAAEPSLYLTPRQLRKMENRPDMILQFAHHLARLRREAGQGEVEVRAQAMCSLNGRRPQLLIDPNVDLTREPRGLAPVPYILPLTEPLPAR